jgi:hypothetical protein
VSDTDSFLEEVAEEVRRDKFYGQLKKYGWIPVAIVLFAVAATAYLEWNKSKTVADAQARGDALMAAFNLDDEAARIDAMAAVADNSVAANALVRIGQASIVAESGDIAGAAAILDDVKNDATAEPIYRELASLKSVILQGEALDIQERLIALETLSGVGAPFRKIALEQQGLALLSAGDSAAAIDVFVELIQEDGISSSMKRRMGQMIIALGGQLPNTPQLLSDQ